jgi:hypothetical protein
MKTRTFIIDEKKLTLLQLQLIIIDLYCKNRSCVSDHVEQEQGTVCSHFKIIYPKLQVCNERELYRWCFKLGLFNNGYYMGENLFPNWPYPLPWHTQERTA